MLTIFFFWFRLFEYTVTHRHFLYGLNPKPERTEVELFHFALFLKRFLRSRMEWNGYHYPKSNDKTTEMEGEKAAFSLSLSPIFLKHYIVTPTNSNWQAQQKIHSTIQSN